MLLPPPVLAAALLLAGCGAGPLTVDAPASVEPADARACGDLVDTLPDTVHGLERRDVEGGEGLVAAWGDPAIVLTCGVPAPAGFTRASSCIEANGTDWYVPDDVLLSEDETLDVTMTAVGVRPRVQVEVPGDYRPEGFADAAAVLGTAVAESLEQVAPCR